MIITQIPAPRIPVMDQSGNFMSRGWYYFMLQVYNATGIGQSFLSWLTEITGDYTVTNEVRHIICNGTLTITLQDPTARDSELIVTNEGTGTITFVGTVNGDTNKQIRYQNTSLRLRPGTDGYKIV